MPIIAIVVIRALIVPGDNQPLISPHKTGGDPSERDDGCTPKSFTRSPRCPTAPAPNRWKGQTPLTSRIIIPP
jgi:hypothetical protein